MPDIVQRHICPPPIREWFDNLPDDYYTSFGALGTPGDDAFIDLRQGEHAFGLSVNGGEYRGPIRFCPWCGEELKVPNA